LGVYGNYLDALWELFGRFMEFGRDPEGQAFRFNLFAKDRQKGFSL
jgi:hypothetical protein